MYMKKIMAMAAVALLGVGTVAAQNSFKGIVKYSIESTGEVTVDLPIEQRTAEIKVSGDDMFTQSPNFTEGADAVLVQGLKQTQCLDFSQILGYMRNEGFEFEYEGAGKLMVQGEVKESDFDSVDIPDTEPGHFYYEYVSGETKTIAGFTAKKMVRHQYDEEGVDHQMVFWYSDEIGPRINILFQGLKGMPLEITVADDEGHAITYTAVEIVKGKVKDADFLLPAGYDRLSDEELKTLMGEMRDAYELLSAE